MKIFGKWEKLLNIIFSKTDGTTGTTTILPTNVTGNVDLTLPPTTDTLVGRDTTDTLTTKTIVASANTITTAASGNITATELDAAIAEGDANLTTHEGVTSTHGVTGDIVGTGGSQTLTSKTLTTPTLITPVINTTVSGTALETDLTTSALSTKLPTAAASKAYADTKVDPTITVTGDSSSTAGGGDLSANRQIVVADNAVLPGTGSIAVPSGTTGERPGSPGNNLIRHNTTTNELERYDGTEWVGLGGGGLVTDFRAANFTAEAGSNHVLTSNITAITLPAGADGDILRVSRDRAGGVSFETSNITLTPDGAETIDGDATFVLDSDVTDFIDFIYEAASTNWITVTPITAGATGGGGSGTGEINYIENPDAEVNTEGWDTYDDGTSATPVDGTGGTASNLTLSIQGTTILRGSASFKLAKGAADAQGEGLSYDFTIDAADRNKLLKISFDYNTDGTYADEDVKVYIYDVTNTTLITPSDNGIIGKDKDDDSSGSRTIGWASTDSTSYRLIFHVTTTSASAYDLYLDNVIVGPGSVATGAVITAWKAYTPSNTQGFGTITSNNLKWRRVGGSVEILGDFTIGTATGSEAQIELPNSYTVDTTSGAGTVQVGTLNRDSSQTIAHTFSALATNGDTFLNFGEDISNGDSVNVLGAAIGSRIGSSQRVSVHASIPVAEFSGSGTVNLMSDNVAAANARAKFYHITGSYGTANTAMPYTNVAYNEGGGFTQSGNEFIANFTGKVRVEAKANFSADVGATQTMRVYVDSVEVVRGPTNSVGAILDKTVAGTIEVTAGDLINVQFTNTGTLVTGTPESSYLILERLADYSAGQPVGFGLATATEYGLVKKGKIKTKTATGADLKTSGTIPGLTFNNLIIGRVYEFSFKPFLVDTSANTNVVSTLFKNGATTVGDWQYRADTESEARHQYSTVGEFTATSTTFSTEYNASATVYLSASSTKMTLKELPNIIDAGTDWD